MKSVEDAYQCIASVLVQSANPNWDELIFQSKILATNCSGMMFDMLGRDGKKQHVELDFSDVFLVNDAALFLRDDLLATTGDRIWGLTFTLYPDGKFKIEYDYNKPEGYEETDETISGDEINQRLRSLGL